MLPWVGGGTGGRLDAELSEGRVMVVVRLEWGGSPLCSVDGRSWIEREQEILARILCAPAAPLSYVDIGTLVESWVLSFFHWCTYS